MKLIEVIITNANVFIALFVFNLALFLLLGWISFYRSNLRHSFQFVVTVFGVSCSLYLAIFWLVFYYVLANTSFISHLHDGDLIEHIKGGL